jgi:hypothetical protein
MRIEECLPCPQCGFRRVVQRGPRAYVCFQCRHSWSEEIPAARRELAAGDLLVNFSIDQRALLNAYRAAIRAGLYTDWPPPGHPDYDGARPPPA